jgi:energy-coupling factor transporter ATP-binding protein EcfA2
MLDHEISIDVDSEALASRLSFLGQGAIQDVAIAQTIAFRVETLAREFRIFEDDRLVDVELSTDMVLEWIHESLHRRLFAAIARRGWVRLHSGLARWNDRRLLIVGEKGSGKTTLLTKLVVEGVDVEGDEWVVLEGPNVAAFPRRLRIKEGTADLVPAVRPLIRECPSVVDEWGTPVFAWEPRRDSGVWRTGFAPVSDVVYIEANHGGRSRLVSIPRHLMARRVMGEVLLDDPEDRSWIGPVCATLAGADCYELRLGDLDLALEQLRDNLVGRREAP